MPRGESRRAGKGFGPSNLTEHAGAFRLAANFVVLHRGKLAPAPSIAAASHGTCDLPPDVRCGGDTDFAEPESVICGEPPRFGSTEIASNERRHVAENPELHTSEIRFPVNLSALGPHGVRTMNKRNHSMRKQLLLSTAALLAGVAIASAQDMGGKAGGSAGGAAQSGAQMERGSAGAGHEQGRGQAQRGAQEQGKQSPSQQGGQAQRESTTGQAQQGQHEPKAQQSQGEGKQGAASESGGRKREQTTGQSPRGQDQMKQGQKGQAQPGQAAQQGQNKSGQREQGKQGQAQRNQGQQPQDHTTGQAPRQQGQTAPQQGQSSAPQQGQAQTGGATAGQAGNVNLTSQQRTRIQQTVLAGRNVPRVNSVNFALSTGTLVPTSVRVVDVGPELIEINSQWRGYKYFVVHDDVVIIDNSRKIVAVVPTGSSRGGARLNSGGGSASALNLSETQIREIQTVLIQKGFDIGRPDGRLGPRTVRALTEFQRKQGFAATGRLDNQTVTALGVSNMGGAQGGATTGQGDGAASQGGAAHQQAPAQQNQGANQPSTSGQGNAKSPTHEGANQPSNRGSQGPAQHQDANEPSSSGQSGASAPATSGQGGASGHNAPAQHKENQQSGGSK